MLRIIVKQKKPDFLPEKTAPRKRRKTVIFIFY
jgi:hypothetical protein